MKIVVQTGSAPLTYESGNFKVNVGDTVLVPYPSWHPDNGSGDGLQGVVTSLKSNYTGYLRKILGVVRREFNPGPPPVVAKVSTPAARVVSVKEIESFIRDANFLVIDQTSFKRNSEGRWVELS